MGPVILQLGLTALTSDPDVNNVGQMNDINCSRVESNVLFWVKKCYFEHASSQNMWSFLWMRRNHKNSRIGKWFILIVEPFMKLNELNHESIVRTGDWTFLFDKRLSFFVVIPVLKNNISDNECHWSRNALDAMNENVFLVFMGSLNEINHFVKQTFDVLVLRIF
jgi:hypothetical protein